MKEQTKYKLEYKLLFSMVVAGKSANFAESVMQKFLQPTTEAQWGPTPTQTPLAWVRELDGSGSLYQHLQACRSGNYHKLTAGFSEAARLVDEEGLDLRTATPEQLEKIKGIGPKTSRFFILWTRPGADYAALDTHILKWLRYLGFEAPKSTPTGKRYRELELRFLEQARLRQMTAGQLDDTIWQWCWRNNASQMDYSSHDSWPAQLRRL